MADNLQTPLDVLEKIYREVVGRADAQGLSFAVSLAASPYSEEERQEIAAYARDEYEIAA